MKTYKFWIIGILIILGLGFMTLRPSLNLALTGDDYLGLWRYYYYINGQGGPKIDTFSYFFTDYGPMDTLTAAIHNFFGFKDQVYYILNIGLRVIASLSFIWPFYKLTKNKWASLGSMAFFLVTTTGLEATDWSFNMPSYVAISLTNTLLGLFILSRNRNHWLIWFSSLILFTLAIISQPIRTMFLPILMIGLEFYWLVTNFNEKTIVRGLLRICLYAFLLTSILKYTSYGGAVSLRGNVVIFQNFQQVVQLFKNGDYNTLISPISQFGRIVLPNDFLYQRTSVWGLPRTFRQVVIPIIVFIVFCLIITRVPKWQFFSLSLLSIVWTAYIWKAYMYSLDDPIQPFELLSYLLGGNMLIFSGFGWIKLKLEKNLQLGIVLSLFLIISGFILFWVRVPGTIYEITGRYLIVSGAGLAWLIATVLAIGLKTKNLALIILFGLLLSLHANSSYKYLKHLSDVRGIELTSKLRGSIKRATNFDDPKVPLVFYFEGDDPEILHHSFLFGFPVIAQFQFNLKGGFWYNIATTDKWTEVESAYLNGESLKRFMPGPYLPVDLENIYAYKLQNRELLDVTDEKRETLKMLQHDKNK